MAKASDKAGDDDTNNADKTKAVNASILQPIRDSSSTQRVKD
jgi:hypothetical protein